MAKSLNVLVVEKHDLLREKIAGVVSRLEDVRMVIQVADCSELTRIAEENAPDLVLMNIRQAHSQRKTIARMKEIQPGAKIFIFAHKDGEQYHLAATQLGVNGVVNSGRLISDIESVLRKLNVDLVADGAMAGHGAGKSAT